MDKALWYLCVFTYEDKTVNLFNGEYTVGAKMEVKVRFFTSLREITGRREETLSFPDGNSITVDAVLKKLANKYGKPFEEYVYDDKSGEPKGFLQFLINGNSTQTTSGLQTEIADGDVLAILPPVGGG